MDRVAKQMVQSQSLPAQQQCSLLLSRFLVTYPLGKRRLQQHLDFLIRNLSYAHPSGRLSVMTLLRSLLSDFPPELLSVHAVKTKYSIYRKDLYYEATQNRSSYLCR